MPNRIVVFPKKKRLRLFLVYKGYTPRFQDGDLFLYGSERLILAPICPSLSKAERPLVSQRPLLHAAQIGTECVSIK